MIHSAADLSKLLSILCVGTVATLLFTAFVTVWIREAVKTPVKEIAKAKPSEAFSVGHYAFWGAVAGLSLAVTVINPAMGAPIAPIGCCLPRLHLSVPGSERCCCVFRPWVRLTGLPFSLLCLNAQPRSIVIHHAQPCPIVLTRVSTVAKRIDAVHPLLCRLSGVDAALPFNLAATVGGYLIGSAVPKGLQAIFHPVSCRPLSRVARNGTMQ